jgi:hypothetical protein
MTDPNPSGESGPGSGRPSLRGVIGLLLFIPWLILDVVLRKHDPSLAYGTGLFIGLVTAYLLSPRPPSYWVMLALGVFLGVSHYFFAGSY